MNPRLPFPAIPLPVREAGALLLSASLASGALASPLATGGSGVKKAATGESKRLSIAHDPLKCLSTEARALVDARVLPGKEMEKSFVYFRAAGTEDFYYVVMRPRAAEDVVAELPRAATRHQGHRLLSAGARPRELSEENAGVRPAGDGHDGLSRRALGARRRSSGRRRRRKD